MGVRSILLFGLFAFSIRLLPAQSGSPQLASERSLEERERRLMAQGDDSPQATREAAARREADYQQRVFYTKAKKFVDLWRHFTMEMNDRQTFNVKLAKEVSKAFHDLEKSDGWLAKPDK